MIKQPFATVLDRYLEVGYYRPFLEIIEPVSFKFNLGQHVTANIGGFTIKGIVRSRHCVILGNVIDKIYVLSITDSDDIVFLTQTGVNEESILREQKL